MLECVMNLSEGRRLELIAELASLAEHDLLDVHADAHHHRSVLTLVGTHAVREITRQAVHVLDLNDHDGVHPRLGVVDVVPFIPLPESTMADAIAQRDAFAHWAGNELEVPCFVYGPERSLPEVRSRAWKDLGPDTGPDRPHSRAGAICVGARDVLIAYNVWVAATDLDTVRDIARSVRSPHVRTLGLAVGDRFQVSMNLTHPDEVGPLQAFDRVATSAAERGLHVEGAELVGLIPARCLASIPKERWTALDLSVQATLEWRLAERNRRGYERG
jgi:glutamate formiminotransferase / 5-formyltetrahydrofolate cyclo-ligase